MNSVNRKILVASVSSLLLEMGFEAAEQSALETLTEMIQSCKYRNVYLPLTFQVTILSPFRSW